MHEASGHQSGPVNISFAVWVEFLALSGSHHVRRPRPVLPDQGNLRKTQQTERLKILPKLKSRGERITNPLSPPPLRFKGAFKALPPKANS